MSATLDIFIILGSLLLIIQCANILVDGSSALARRFHLSPMLIGLTIVAFGTSAPEFIVSLFSALRGEGGLAVANIAGSVSSNILLGIGIAAVMRPLLIRSSTVWREIPFGFLAAALVFLLLVGFGPVSHEGLSRIDGSLLMFCFAAFLTYTVYGALGKNSREPNSEIPVIHEPLWKAILSIILGLVGLLIGGELIVSSAVAIAQSLGLPVFLIGTLITGPGTSLPEIITVILAVRKNEPDIVAGGMLGSNIFNLLFILGFASLIAPITYEADLFTEWFVILIAHTVLFASLFIGKRHYIERWQGVVFILLYIVNVGIQLTYW